MAEFVSEGGCSVYNMFHRYYDMGEKQKKKLIMVLILGSIPHLMFLEFYSEYVLSHPFTDQLK